jgi:hypothetical protein
MKTAVIPIGNKARALSFMLSVACSGLLALSLSGCADAYYAQTNSAPEAPYNTYHAPYYYPYYPWYSYYGGAYNYGY